MASVLRRSRDEDAELARRAGAGDGAAFAMLDARHRRALVRYAGSLLRRSEHDAEDVVQDVLIRAHEALRAGDAPHELRPWLYRLTRNRAIDEVRRKRWGDKSLDDAHVVVAHERDDPDAVLSRRESMRRLVEDLAALPVRQREALLARELDGQRPQQVAAQLGVTVDAAQKLAIRARENLVKTRAARDADCDGVRAVLLAAHERGVRPSEHGLRHVSGCDTCRAYQRDIRRLSRRLHALDPAFVLPIAGGVAKLVAGGGAKAAAGAAAAVAVVATGGIVVLGTDVVEEGDPAPFRLAGIRDANGRPVTPGDPVPGNNIVQLARVRLPAGPRTPLPRPTLTIPCPAGMRLAGMQMPELRVPRLALVLSKESIPGHSTSARIEIVHTGLKRSYDVTVGISCRRPDATGSIAQDPRKLAPGERLGHVCTDGTGVNIRDAPNGRPLGFATRSAPVAIQRRDASGRWTRVALDTRLEVEGWIRTSDVCRRRP